SSPAALAHEGEAQVLDAVTAESVQIQDLGVADPGTLPGSPFYFWKEMKRSVRSFFTFGSVAKAELSLQFANEKAAEARAVEEKDPNNLVAVEVALSNYKKAQERLGERMERLKETSENPNVDRLLDKVAERTILHTKLFDELEAKFSDHENISKESAEIRKHIGETAGKAMAKDVADKIAARFDKALLGVTGGALKNLRALEVMDFVSEKAPEEARESLEDLKGKLAERFGEDISDDEDELEDEDIEEAIKELPGDLLRRSAILREIEPKSGLFIKELPLPLDSITAEKAKERILEAEKVLAKLRSLVERGGDAKDYLARAEGHLKNARVAYEEK
ncbi:MAG: DUF5667 domain-containing protein, partial [Patescibacteria group bacterium]